MAYTDLQENTKIRASVLNANFDALRGELQQIGANIQTDVSTQITTATSTMSTQITQMTDTINNCVKLSGTQTISGNKTFTSVTYVKATTTAGSAISNVAVTKNKIQSSYQLGTGIVQKFGQATVKSNTTSVSVNFDTAFPNRCTSIVLTHEGDTNVYYKAKNVSTTGFTVQASSSAGYDLVAFWIALGY